jgi:acetyl-CoA synthetase
MAAAEFDKPVECSPEEAALVDKILEEARKAAGEGASPVQVWSHVQHALKPSMPDAVHRWCYLKTYEGVEDVKPSWVPSEQDKQNTNIYKMMQKKGFNTYQEFYEWSVNMETREEFWKESVEKIGIVWEEEPTRCFDLSKGGPAHVSYFPNGRLNISDSCFNKRDPQEPAMVYAMESDPRGIQTMSFSVLERLSNQIANAIHSNLQLNPGDAVAICMPMTPESIAIYLGIVKAGCVVVSIADSFSATEIATRCRLGNAKAIFTQDVIYRGAKFLPLFTRILEADEILQEEKAGSTTDEAKETKSDPGSDVESMKVVVLPGLLHAGPYSNNTTSHSMDFDESGTWDDKDANGNPVALHESVVEAMREGMDFSWHDIMYHASDEFTSVKRGSMDACNILFSSGTTGEPKAIVWSQSTPIKCAIDGHYHQDVQVGDRVAWPTNIGWMMGPWLLFQLVNGATLGIFNGVTSTDAFCQFVEEAKISMVGVIPSLVKAWQARNATEKCDWSCVRRFSSTGEASDPENYLWLVSRVPGYAPVIEYCGGTEIGGSYLSSTLMQPNVPSMFSTPVLGSQLFLLDADGVAIEHSEYKPGPNGTQSGEIALVPPSIGYSTHLLNRNHYETYYKGMRGGPNGEVLRRHGDEMEIVRNSQHLSSTTNAVDTATPYFRALGRCDDTMNIGGIKVSSVEIERVCNLVPEIKETAAIGVSGKHGGPCKLVIYVVLAEGAAGVDIATLKPSMQKMIKTKLNPLFGISDVVVTDSLPRTASNKVMRRLLRDEYVQKATA